MWIWILSAPKWLWGCPKSPSPVIFSEFKTILTHFGSRMHPGRQKWLLQCIHCILRLFVTWTVNKNRCNPDRSTLLSRSIQRRTHFMLQMWCSPFITPLILFYHTCLLLRSLISCLWFRWFSFFTIRLDHSQFPRDSPTAPLRLLLFGCGFILAAVMLLDRGCRFHADGWFIGKTRVFSDVDSKVGVKGLQLFGKELVGQRVEAVRAPV